MAQLKAQCPAMIILRNVKKSFGKKEVLQNVTLEVPKHELLSLVGPSGCGKTTTLNIVAGLMRPDQGTVIIENVLVDGNEDGHLVHVGPSRRKVGYVFQDYALFPHMTVRDNISYGLKPKHLSELEVKGRTQDLLQLVGLPDNSEQYPAHLSGGQKQRVALARALAIEPHILLLDEPLAALDPRTRESLRIELKKMLEALDVTSIFVTHELSEAYAISNKIAVMGAGRIEQIGHRDEIFSEPNSEYVARFLGQNVYSGTVISNSFPLSTIEINGIRFSASHVNNIGNRAVLVTIRPEDVVLSSDLMPRDLKSNGRDYNTLQGKIVEIVRINSAIEVTVDVGFPVRLTMTATSLRELDLKEGGSVSAHFKVDSVRISPVGE
jgi:putative spermidine/putrescine transport system ATP-binding protein